jgi:NAD(P)-dependent dehydrogenase (short-subunit alcohol dehydrogenase family)
MPRLTGKITIVTGAAQGIGAAIAQAFVNEGAQVIVTDINDQRGQALAEALGPQATYSHLDVRVESDWSLVLTEITKQHARLDVLVNNAGITGFDTANPQPQDPEHTSLQDWTAVHDTNLIGTFLGCKHAIKAMRPTKQPGSIINIGSRSGVVGTPMAAAYAASKGAIRNHTKSVALYCAQEALPIRCNCIQPAAILTPMWEPMLGDETSRETNIARFAADCPLQRFGTPEEVAALAVHLASDESAYTTGAEFNIDGGMLAGTAQRIEKPKP